MTVDPRDCAADHPIDKTHPHCIGFVWTDAGACGEGAPTPVTRWINQTPIGDCRQPLRRMLADRMRIQTCVTNPPYGYAITARHDGTAAIQAASTASAIGFRTLSVPFEPVRAPRICHWLPMRCHVRAVFSATDRRRQRTLAAVLGVLLTSSALSRAAIGLKSLPRDHSRRPSPVRTASGFSRTIASPLVTMLLVFV